MESIRFLTQSRPDIGAVTEVVPALDGVKLTDLIHDFELRAGMVTRATSYGGLIPASFDFGPLDQHFEGASSWHEEDGRLPLLGCSCGEWGCWPLLARIAVTEDLVSWSEFQQPHRKERDYSGFGPFSFVRAQYEYALAELLAALQG